ncbi:unnamed protein product, partial [Ixodes pacificus]
RREYRLFFCLVVSPAPFIVLCFLLFFSDPPLCYTHWNSLLWCASQPRPSGHFTHHFIHHRQARKKRTSRSFCSVFANEKEKGMQSLSRWNSKHLESWNELLCRLNSYVKRTRLVACFRPASKSHCCRDHRRGATLHS